MRVSAAKRMQTSQDAVRIDNQLSRLKCARAKIAATFTGAIRSKERPQELCAGTAASGPVTKKLPRVSLCPKGSREVTESPACELKGGRKIVTGHGQVVANQCRILKGGSSPGSVKVPKTRLTDQEC